MSEDVGITIRIYSVFGRLTRTLNLGHKPAGFYTDRAKTVHWDGRNDNGESVSSGVYFYTLEAGDFRATLKMVAAE